jgi:pimeloyl-ACP methyl ester carboxylesterase
VFLQHFSGTMDDWDPAVVNDLAEDRPVVVFDNTGVGKSSGKTPDNVLQMTTDAARFMSALGVSNVDLLGFSLGGLVAQQLAVDHPMSFLADGVHPRRPHLLTLKSSETTRTVGTAVETNASVVPTCPQTAWARTTPGCHRPRPGRPPARMGRRRSPGRWRACRSRAATRPLPRRVRARRWRPRNGDPQAVFKLFSRGDHEGHVPLLGGCEEAHVVASSGEHRGGVRSICFQCRGHDLGAARRRPLR